MTTLHLMILTCFVLISYSYQQDTTVQPDEDLATKINCASHEFRHFKYNSITNMWDDVNGQITVTADLVVNCIGNDSDGTYGPEGMKYQAQITSLSITAGKSREEYTLTRKKRGIGDFFSNAWRKVKNFFINLFGGTPEPEPGSGPSGHPDIEDRSQSSPSGPSPEEEKKEQKEEEEEEREGDFVYDNLYTEPFKFVQMANGSVPDIWFTEADTDSRVRNFKRHLVDSFASQLSLKPQHVAVVETSVMGEHISTYNIRTGSSHTSAHNAGLETEGTTDSLEDDDEDNTVVVEKVVTQEDILKFAPTSETAVINDLAKMELKASQTQTFRDGKLVSTSGTSSLSLFNDDVRSKRQRREAGEDNDVMSYYKVYTEFELKLARIQRRSLDNLLMADMEDKTFLAAGREAELEDLSIKHRLKALQKSIGDTASFVQNLMKDISFSNDSSENEKLQVMLEVVEQEVRYGLDQEPESVSKEVREILTKEVLGEVCFANVRRCIDMLQILARAGGDHAEQVLLSYLKDDTLDVEIRKQVADLLSDVSNPSAEIIDEVIGMLLSNRLNPGLLGPVSLGVSNLAVAADSSQKKKLAEALVLILDSSWSASDPESDPLTLDALEAIGNLGEAAAIGKVLEICYEAVHVDVQISCAHSMRYMTNLREVQSWMEVKATTGTCDVIHAIIGSLLDSIHAQEMSGDDRNWPRAGHFNGVDRVLKNNLVNSPPQFECATSDALRYFRRKNNPEAQELASSFFSEDSEPFEPGSSTRQRRGLWDEMNCNEWTDDNKFTAIQDKKDFDADRKIYNKRKSCLAFRRLGLKGASADVYAGIFAGVKQPSDPPKYKLFSKFVSSVNFLGHEMEIGSFYFHHHGNRTKSYIRILGKTRQEFHHEDCTPSELRYHPITHIPLYQVRIAVVQLSLGIHMSSELVLETQCPATQKYALKPLTNVRFGGEAMGTVLFIRGAVNVGGNFNYYLRFTFAPIPDMCITGQHGYDPMSVSIEAYYQLWNVRKLSWGKPKIWKPGFLMWEVNSGDRRPWFNDTCVLDDKSTSSPTSTTPSPEIQDPVAIPQPNDENEVLIVRSSRRR